MAKSSTYSNSLLKLIFQGTAIANLADNAASAPATNLYLSLHTADPSAGNQSTNEVSYTNYARVAVQRSASGFTITANALALVSAATFPTGGVGSSPIAAFVGVGVAASGAGVLLESGAITPNITCGNTIAPVISSISGTET
jgi:hypothetical protein